MAIELHQFVTILKNGSDMIKQLYQYESEVKDIKKHGEFMRIIGKLDLELANADKALAQQIRESQKLEERILALEKENKELKNSSVEMVEENAFHYKGNGCEPICPNCFRKGQVITLSNSANISYKCSECGYKVNAIGGTRVRKKL